MPEDSAFKQAAQEALQELAAEEAGLDVAASADNDSNSGPVEGEQPTVESDVVPDLFQPDDVEEPAEQPTVDVDSIRIPIDEKLMTVEEIRSLIQTLQAGNMRQDDYTRKTQELATERKDLEKAKILWDSLHGPDAAKIVSALYQRVAAGQPPTLATPELGQPKQEPTDIEALVEAKIQERLASDPRIQALEQQEAFDKIEAVFAQIESDRNVKLSNADKQRVLEEAQASQTSDLLLVFDAMMARQARADAAKKNVIQNATKRSDNSSENADEATTKTFKSFREAMQDTLREEGLLEAIFQ